MSKKSYNDTWSQNELGSALKTLERDKKKSREDDKKRKEEKNERDSGDSRHRSKTESESKSQRKSEDKSRNREKEDEDRHQKNKSRVDNDHEDETKKHRKEKKSHHDEDDDDRRRHRKHKDEDEDEDRKKHRKHRDNNDDDDDEERRRRKEHKERKEKLSDNEDEKKKHRRDEDDYESKKRHHKSHKKEKHDESEEERKSEMKVLKQVVEENESDRESKKKSHKEVEKPKTPEQNYDEVYEEDFDDFEDDEKEVVTRKESPKVVKTTKVDLFEKKSRKYDDDDDDKIIKANKYVNVPTEDVRAYNSKIYFNHDSADRQRRRASDLLKIIELDRKSFTLFEMNPGELSTIYASNMKHAKVQTNEGREEIEIQTDDIDSNNKWTQNPPTDNKECGGDNDDRYNFSIKYKLDYDNVRMQTFLSSSTKLIESILNEQRTIQNKSLNASKQSKLDFCIGYNSVSLPEFFTTDQNINLKNCTFCSNNEQYFTINFSYKHKADYFNRTIIIVCDTDDLDTPYRYLTLEGVSTSSCFASSLVFSGNSDGSVAVWDIREMDHLHKFTAKKTPDEIVFRNPTYTTAGILQYENHTSEVICINVLHSSSKSNDLSMQIASLESNSRIIIWNVIENTDGYSEIADLGLLPGGKIKLIKSTTINLDSSVKVQNRFSFRSLWMSSPNKDANNFFVCTDIGKIKHVSRDGGICAPSIIKSQFTDGILEVKSLVFHHEIENLILAGYGNGELRLYNANYRDPLNTWMFFTNNNSIEKIEWLKCKYSSAVVLDSNNIFYLWDFLIDDTKPIISSQYDQPVICSSISSFTQNIEEAEANYKLLVCDSKNKIKLHIFKSEPIKLNKKEKKYFERLVQSYLNEC